MPENKKIHPREKSILHPRSKHRERYDFKLLITACPELAPFVWLNKYHDESIDFSNPEAVKLLNKALLKHFYGIGYWDIPGNYLCPPIPGRADYIHYMADLLSSKNNGRIPSGDSIKCLDIGVGANCIYPIIGNREYGWTFTGTDIDPVAIESARKIVDSNPILKGGIDFRLQKNPEHIFPGIIRSNELFDMTICNPPFHASFAEAQAGTIRKLNNLNLNKSPVPELNFGGRNNELWCHGGERRFIRDMIHQSKQFAHSCFWFSTLVSKQASLGSVLKMLKEVAPVETKTIPMGQGNKMSRIVTWTFLSPNQQETWRDTRWNSSLGMHS